jgi:flagellar biosynthesis GTPase FlhF
LTISSETKGEITRAQAEYHYTDLKASIDKLTPQLTSESQPLIHTLPTQQEIEGRTEECTTILRAMASSKEHVVTFVAPGGFGKTALLAKVVQQLSSDGKTLREQVTLPKW